MRSKLIAGNWKMNTNWEEAKALFQAVNEFPSNNKSMAVCVPACYLAGLCPKHPNLSVFAQDCSAHEKGAYTGEISATMLQSIGVNAVILGHSERRAYFNETDALIANKVNTAISHNMTAIFCFGEELKDRQSGNHFNIVENQLKDGLFHITAADWEKVVLAYEPVWAIGTGKTATSDQAQEIHAYIRSIFAAKYGQEIADQISILYGGSVKASNANEIFSQPDVDGGLVGGASLIATEFAAIIKALK
jgi:triosephosphate isomerase